jgi:alpha-tubulin suppressor-like RCC1 family protein
MVKVRRLVKAFELSLFILLFTVLVIGPGIASSPGFIDISAGRTHSIALADDGTVWTWGRNEWGELGDGTHNDRMSPAKVEGLWGIRQVLAGDGVSFAMKNDGTVWTWGLNKYGQLCDGTTNDRGIPVRANINNVKAISLGGAGTYVIALLNDGTVWSWGKEPGSSEDIINPSMVEGLSGIVAVSAGFDHCLALDDKGRVWAWGDNRRGQIGSGSSKQYSLPVIMFSDAIAVAAGNGYSLALKNDGTVWAWGDNEYGELGDETVESKTTPIRVVGIEHINSITTVNNIPISIAIGDDGTVWAWGYNNVRFGVGHDINSIYSTEINPHPVPLPHLAGSIKISPGNYHVLALRNGSIWAWGINNYGNIGDGTLADRDYPVRIIGSDSGSANVDRIMLYLLFRYDCGSAKVGQVIAGTSHSAALMDDGTVFMWGSNSKGQYGDGTATTSYLPVKVPAPENVASVALGQESTLYLKNDGTVWACGNNAQGQLGDGTTNNRYKIVPVPKMTDVKEIATGISFSVALKNDGTVWAWGNNMYGTLGDGTYISKYSPEKVNGLPFIVKIAAGFNHVLALDSEGTVWTWGLKTEYGVGEYDDKGSPFSNTIAVKVPISQVISIAAGGTNSLALKNDGTIWAWGDNREGQIGDGTKVSRADPVQVQGLENVVDIDAGSDFSLAKLNNGQIWAWGNLIDGMLENGTKNAEYLTPVRVKTLENYALISLRSGYIFAMTTDGAIEALGLNDAGVLGDGTTEYRQKPVRVAIGLQKNSSGNDAPTTNNMVTNQSLSRSLPATGMDISTVMMTAATITGAYMIIRRLNRKN